MAETPDHSTHLKSLVEQQAALPQEEETTPETTPEPEVVE